MLLHTTVNLRKCLHTHFTCYYKSHVCASYLKQSYKSQAPFYCCYSRDSKVNIKLNSYRNANTNKRENQFAQEHIGLNDRILDSDNFMDKDIKSNQSLYSEPLVNLNAIYQIVNNEFDKKCIFFTYSRTKNCYSQQQMQCVIDVTWPAKMSFSDVASSKVKAASNAALKCLQWLHECKKIRHLKPQIYDSKYISNLIISQKSINVNLTPELKNQVKLMISTFDREIKPILTTPLTAEANLNENLEELENDLSSNSKLLDFTQNDRLTKNAFKKRNIDINLPIMKHKEEILNSIENNQVLVIKGDTGCGKSTQVPQFIVDAYAEQNKADKCNVVVAVPRRLPVITLAQRVAWERNENIGDKVGYHIRFESVIPQMGGSILYCTTGILLRKLEAGNALDGVSHVIIDEAHERQVNIDILLKMFKSILQHNTRIKFIIMSASINVELFQQYFSCTVINIPGKLYPVKMHFIDDIHFLNSNLWNQNLKNGEISYEGIKRLIEWIIGNKPPGGILCFLPGWQEIKYLYKILKDSSMNNLLLLPLHSKIPHNVQKKVFNRVPNNITKIILATDVAETGITITDITYVIDIPIKRELQWNKSTSLCCLNFSLISQANIIQRRGRAGRMQPGESYHLITQKDYNQLDMYPKPEIFKIPLEETIVITKALSDEKTLDFFTSMIEPPSNASISIALYNLKSYGILDKDENLTSLGKRIKYFSLNPKISKAVILSCIFQCLKPILSIAVEYSTSERKNIQLDDEINTISNYRKTFLHETSDHISTSKYFESLIQRDNKLFDDSDYKINTIKKLYDLHMNSLQSSRMISSETDFKHINLYANNNELIRAVLFASTNQLIKKNSYGYKKGYFTHLANKLIAEDKKEVIIEKNSVNYKRKVWPSNILTYINKMQFTTRHSCIVFDTSMLSPLSVLLFGYGTVYSTNPDKVSPNSNEVLIHINNINNLSLRCEKETANLLLKFRNILWDIVNFILEYEGTNDNQDKLNLVNLYKNDVMILLSKMLSESSKDIDNVINDEKEKNKGDDDNDDDDYDDDDDDDNDNDNDYDCVIEN